MATRPKIGQYQDLERRVQRALQRFRNTYRTEGAFFLRWTTLPAHHRQALLDWWAPATDWAVIAKLRRLFRLRDHTHVHPPDRALIGA